MRSYDFCFCLLKMYKRETMAFLQVYCVLCCTVHDGSLFRFSPFFPRFCEVNEGDKCFAARERGRSFLPKLAVYRFVPKKPEPVEQKNKGESAEGLTQNKTMDEIQDYRACDRI